MSFVFLIALAECLFLVNPLPVCRISQFQCRNNKCIRLDRYCDGMNDCGDKSDEPPFCTACNRTFYGDVGATYDLELPKPRSDRLPFICHLTFTANGRHHGDFVQLLFDSFHVGKFDDSSPVNDACPSGYMQIMELGRPFTGGSWCGFSSGLAVYYSETTTITATVKLFQFQGNDGFQFKIRYRFLREDEAVARFGSASEPSERGQPVPGTYCGRIFYECSKKRCRIQSPNFPGIYPRNVTCHFSIRQKEIPTCKHAMIAVKQENSYKIQIKRSVVVASVNKTKEVRAWNDCSDDEDRLIFHDGSSANDPVLVKFCGGDWLPRVTSRGPEMFVVFHSTPFGVPFRSPSNGRYPFRGFELDVDVVFADSDSLDFSRQSKVCEFWVNASDSDGGESVIPGKGRSGYIRSPLHTLPPGTTCTWHFAGFPGDLVWIYFVSYFRETLIPVRDAGETGPTADKSREPTTGSTDRTHSVNAGNNCTTRLLIWDGGGEKTGRALVLGEYCDSELPKLCDQSSLRNLTRTTRPCSLRESYLSIGSNLTVQVHSEMGTALHPVTFKMKYEFVDTRLGGEQWNAKRTDEFANSPCSRIFRRKKKGIVRSPRNVFFFGKGGAVNLSCLYRIEGYPYERVKLTLLNASFGDKSCRTKKDPHSRRPKCVRDSGRITEISVHEAPWRNVVIPHSCFCDNSTVGDSIEFSARAIEIHFKISHFNATDDFVNFNFDAEFEMINGSECTRRQKVGGSGGEFAFSYPPATETETNCYGLPWLVEGYQNTSLFLLTWGTFMEFDPSPEEMARCPTKNRILIYSGKPTRLLRVVCPQEPDSRPFAVHIFSEEWFGVPSISARNGPIYHLEPPRPPSFIVEFIGFEEGIAQINWLEISKTRLSYLRQRDFIDPSMVSDNSTDRNGSADVSSWDCPHKCPELNACISESLWCDGRRNCPSGYDESEIHCGVGHKFISLIPGGMYAVLGASAAMLTFLCLFLAVLITFRFGKGKSGKTDRGTCGEGPPSRVLTDDSLLDPDYALSS